ncbi:hypothetical protein GCM10010129_73390 [Streptomyces fumigatiscleroticus]|nr:hypothetical protein GCM10010129_73390 [Streptomyces fumigatiscleroticus]
MNKRLARFAVAGAASVGIAATMVVGGAGTGFASTISTGYVQLCAQGNYSAFVQFPDRNNLESVVVSPGTCWKEKLGGGYGGADGYEPINVFGVFNNAPHNTFKIDTVWYNGNVSGVGIGAEGTTANAGAGAYVITW